MEASGKKKNEHNRKKSITIGFRVTPQERDELYKRIHLSLCSTYGVRRS